MPDVTEKIEWNGCYSTGTMPGTLEPRKPERERERKSGPKVARSSILDLREMSLGER